MTAFRDPRKDFEKPITSAEDYIASLRGRGLRGTPGSRSLRGGTGACTRRRIERGVSAAKRAVAFGLIS